MKLLIILDFYWFNS